MAFGFRNQALLLGGGQRFDALTLDSAPFNTVAMSSFSRRLISASWTLTCPSFSTCCTLRFR